MTRASDTAPPAINATLDPSGLSLAAGVNPRIVEALEEYRAAQENNQRPSRQQLLQRYADVAQELAACLDVHDFVQKAAAKLGVPELDGSLPSGITNNSTSNHSTSNVAGDTILGDYRIVREVGRGGMGVVYEAQQLSLRRRVALKVLPFAAVLDARQLTRFQNEAQAAAALHHTNIVPVFSVGCERGVHFYAMQFIAGRSLAQVIDELKRAAGVDSKDCVKPLDLAHPQQIADPASAPAVLPLPPGEGRFEGVPCSSASAVPPLPPGEGRGEGVPSLSTDTTFETCSQKTLDESPRRDPATSGLPPRKSPEFFHAVARLGVQAAEALQHAHDTGIVHRDIKPANLMLDTAGNLWVTDFGLARLDTDAGLTMTGDVLGTLRYMSPEQMAGQPARVDHRTDVYSLGASLYELLCLRAVVAGTSRQQLLQQAVDAEPTPPRRHHPAIPVDLETIVLKALQKSTADRYATAQDLADDLRRFLSHKPIQAKPPSLLMRTRKWVRRHRQLTVGLASVFSILTLALGLALVARQRGIEKDQERTQRVAAEQRLVATSAQLSEAHLKLAESYSEALQEPAAIALRQQVIADCDIAIKANSQVPAFFQIRGVARCELGHYAEAAEDFSRALTLGGTSPALYKNRGTCLFLLKKYPEAIVDFTKSCQLDPINATQYRLHARACIELKQYDEAIAVVKRGLIPSPGETGTTPPFGHVHCLYGKCLLIKGDTAGAIDEFARAIEILRDKNDFRLDRTFYLPASYDQRACCYEMLGEFEKALLDWNQAIEIRPTYFQAFGNRAYHYEVIGQYHLAHADYEQASELAPADTAAALNLIRFLTHCADLDFRDVPRATTLAEIAVNSWQDNADAWCCLGAAQYRSGQWPAALQSLQRAHKLRGTPGESISDLLLLAMTHWQLGDRRAAADRYAEAVEAVREHKSSQRYLSRLQAEAARLMNLADDTGAGAD